MTEVDVKKLATLSRIAVSDEELAQLEREIPEILTFVEQIQEAAVSLQKEVGPHYNVMREDDHVHESGEYSEELVASMPESKNGYLKVRKIINQD